jgi:hypothetical protein
MQGKSVRKDKLHNQIILMALKSKTIKLKIILIFKTKINYHFRLVIIKCSIYKLSNEMNLFHISYLLMEDYDKNKEEKNNFNLNKVGTAN